MFGQALLALEERSIVVKGFAGKGEGLGGGGEDFGGSFVRLRMLGMEWADSKRWGGTIVVDASCDCLFGIES